VTESATVERSGTATSETARTLYLAVVHSPVERSLVRDWVARQPAADRSELVELPSLRAPKPAFARLAAQLDVEESTRLVPVRVLWLPRERDGRRRATVTDLVLGRNPYQPPVRGQAKIAAEEPDRCPVVEGDAADVGELRARFVEAAASDEPAGFARYVTRRAELALERADHRILGQQYKAPRLVKEEILSSARFRAGLERLQAEVGESRARPEDAERILDEMAAGWGRLVLDVIPKASRMVFERGFDPEVDVEPEQVERVRTTLETYPAVLLWSHRSNLDTMVLQTVMHENGLTKPHTFGGINMAFGPMGALMRRAGVIFIRRGIGDDPLYKYVLRQYVAYLVEKRFVLSWSIEGTRSRTGKMLPPKLGLLGYVTEAYLDGRADDVMLQPVSIAFDQLHETSEYAEYARGATKAPEGMKWLVRYIKAQGERHFGKVYVRFSEPVSMRAFLGAPNDPLARDVAARRLALQKMAFEVAWRINQATPVTAVALVTATLLAARGVGMTAGQVHRALQDALDYLDQMEVPRAASVTGLRSLGGIHATLDALTSGGPATVVADGREPVWLIGPEKQLEATFYRNSMIHVYLGAALCELAMLAAVGASEDPVEAFWRSAYRLRALLKFEFYFEDREGFRRRISAEMLRRGEDWEDRLRRGRAEVRRMIAGYPPVMAPFMLRPFLESYLVVMDVLANGGLDPGTEVDRSEVVKRSLALGRQYVAQHRVASSEPVSTLLFTTALQVAESEGLLGLAPDRQERARSLHAELREVVRRCDSLERIATQLMFGAG
jgi:glycerol-3-phosphate O-acyltransferase